MFNNFFNFFRLCAGFKLFLFFITILFFIPALFNICFLFIFLKCALFHVLYSLHNNQRKRDGICMEFSFLLRQYCLLGEYTHMTVKAHGPSQTKGRGLYHSSAVADGLMPPAPYTSARRLR